MSVAAKAERSPRGRPQVGRGACGDGRWRFAGCASRCSISLARIDRRLSKCCRRGPDGFGSRRGACADGRSGRGAEGARRIAGSDRVCGVRFGSCRRDPGDARGSRRAYSDAWRATWNETEFASDAEGSCDRDRAGFHARGACPRRRAWRAAADFHSGARDLRRREDAAGIPRICGAAGIAARRWVSQRRGVLQPG